VAGHSHWAGIKHKKAIIDAKRGKVFSRMAKEIIVAAKAGGGKVDANMGLRAAVDRAKAVNMPKDKIERAIKSGTGELPGVTYERVGYEGYGPGGVAILLDLLTDSRNRSAAELRKIFSLRGGNMEGSVAWMFESKGLIGIDAAAIEEDALMELALEAGADDIQTTDGGYEVTCSPSDFSAVKQAILDAGIEPTLAEVTMLPQNLLEVDFKTARKALTLLEELDDHEDVQNVYTNLNIPEELANAE